MWRGPESVQQLQEVRILRHNYRRDGSCSQEDGLVRRLEQAVFTNGVALEAKRLAHPDGQCWRELGIEPDGHAATMG